MGAFKAGDTFLLARISQKQHLHVSDHTFVKRRTAVSYDFMQELPTEALEKLEAYCASGQGNSFRRHDPVSPELLKRIRKGALLSDLTPKGMVRALKERLGIESVDDL